MYSFGLRCADSNYVPFCQDVQQDGKTGGARWIDKPDTKIVIVKNEQSA